LAKTKVLKARLNVLNESAKKTTLSVTSAEKLNTQNRLLPERKRVTPHANAQEKKEDRVHIKNPNGKPRQRGFFVLIYFCETLFC